MKKYGGSLEAVMRTGREARAELDLLDTASLDLRGLDARVKETSAALTKAAAALSRKREAAATSLANWSRFCAVWCVGGN